MTQETLKEIREKMSDLLSDSKDYSAKYYPPTSDGDCSCISIAIENENDDSLDSYKNKIDKLAKEFCLQPDDEDYRTVNLNADWDYKTEGEQYDGVDEVVDLKKESDLSERLVSEEYTLVSSSKNDSASSGCSKAVDRPSVRNSLLHDVGNAGKLALIVGAGVMVGSLAADVVKEGKCDQKNLKESAKRGIIAGGAMFLLGVGFMLLNRH